MAGFADILRNGVALANSLTADLQPSVQHYSYSGNDGMGGKSFSAPVSRSAIVETKQKLVQTQAGEEVLSTHVITFLTDVSVDPRDKFVLPDGSQRQVLSISGFADKDTGGSFYRQVYLGA